MRTQTIAVCFLLAVFLISSGSEVTAQVRVDPAEMAERINVSDSSPISSRGTGGPDSGHGSVGRCYR